MNGTALDLKDYVEQKDMVHRYGRQDIIYVMLDKRIDHLADDIKDLKGEIKGLRTEVLGEIGKTNQRIDAVSMQTNQKIDALSAQTTQRIDALSSQMVSMKTWGIGLLITILLVVLAPHIVSFFG